VDPAGLARPSLSEGANGAESLPAWRHSPRFFRGSASNPEGNGVHQLVSRMPWVWWPQVAGSPLRGKAIGRPAVPPSPQAAVQQWVPGPENGSPGGFKGWIGGSSPFQPVFSPTMCRAFHACSRLVSGPENGLDTGDWLRKYGQGSFYIFIQYIIPRVLHT
jgi:hypothetical protein